MKPLHTPGPWEGEKLQSSGAYVVHVMDGEIAEIFEESFGQKIAMENLRLITSAPDLLEACEIAYQHLLTTEEGISPAIVALKVALEKARGK